MNIDCALVLFDAMNEVQRFRAVCNFDLIRGTFPDVRDAFTQAVSEEADKIEREMLAEQKVEGIA